MNVLASIPRDEAIRPDRMALTTFDAFRIVPPKVSPFNTEHAFPTTYSLGPVDAHSLDDALATVLTSGQSIEHKDHLLIRETGARGVQCHLFAVKRQAAPIYVWRDHQQVREHRLYAAPVCVIDGGVVA